MRTNLCKVPPHVLFQVLWDFQWEWTPLTLSCLLHLLLMVLGMSEWVVVFIQQLQLLQQVA